MNYITPLNLKEKEYLAKELLQRMKDILYMNGPSTVVEMVEKFSRLSYSEKDGNVDFWWNVSFKVNDLIQIIGRKRRRDKE